MAVLGITEHRIVGYEDGSLDRRDPEATARIDQLIDEIRPDTILTFGSDGGTFHPDHIAVHHWVTAAWHRRLRPCRLLYATPSVEFLDRLRDAFEEWNMYWSDESPSGVPAGQLTMHLRLTADELDRKLTALRAMASQTSALLATIDAGTSAAQIAEEGFVAAASQPLDPIEDGADRQGPAAARR
jgi:LmbE family N-acetylglucosaminyl deacetylase